MGRLNLWIVGATLAATVVITGTSRGENPKFVLREADFVISQEEALRFSDEVISTILIGFAGGQEGPEPLRRRLRTLIQMNKARGISYVAVPAFYPDRALHVVAKVQMVGSDLLLLAFIPELMEWRSQLSPTDFRYGILVAFAHEMIHVELGQEKHSEKVALKDEGIAWGKTVMEIIRPLEAQGVVLPPEYKAVSSRLKAFADNYEDPRWRRTFRLH